MKDSYVSLFSNYTKEGKYNNTKMIEVSAANRMLGE